VGFSPGKKPTGGLLLQNCWQKLKGPGPVTLVPILTLSPRFCGRWAQYPLRPNTQQVTKGATPSSPWTMSFG